jgi:hypothetical protein
MARPMMLDTKVVYAIDCMKFTKIGWTNDA